MTTSATSASAGAEDLPFLLEMLHAAVCWRPGSCEDVSHADRLMDEPLLAVYLEGWGRPGDVGLVARRDGRAVGAVWVRRGDIEHHGFGFVDPDTPELTLAVVASERGRGVGRELMEALLDDPRLSGVDRLSLSVEDDNPARALYERLGFTTWRSASDSRTLVIDLAEGRRLGGLLLHLSLSALESWTIRSAPASFALCSLLAVRNEADDVEILVEAREPATQRNAPPASRQAGA